MFPTELARDFLNATGKYRIIGGIVSPVSDAYGKKVSDVVCPFCSRKVAIELETAFVRICILWSCHADVWSPFCMSTFLSFSLQLWRFVSWSCINSRAKLVLVVFDFVIYWYQECYWFIVVFSHKYSGIVGQRKNMARSKLFFNFYDSKILRLLHALQALCKILILVILEFWTLWAFADLFWSSGQMWWMCWNQWPNEDACHY